MIKIPLQPTSNVLRVKVLTVWRFLIALIVLCALVIAAIFYLGEQSDTLKAVPEWLLKFIVMGLLILGLYLLKGLISQTIQVEIRANGLYYEQALTKWGNIKATPETLAWAEIRGWHLMHAHASADTFSPPSFMIYLTDNTYRSMVVFKEQDVQPIILHLQSMKKHLGDMGGDFDPEKYGKVLNIITSMRIVAWIIWPMTMIMGVISYGQPNFLILMAMFGGMGVIILVVLYVYLQKKRAMEL